MRIAVLNNYSFERVWQEVRQGDKPDNHLFGLNYFADMGHEIELVPWRTDGFWPALQRWLNRLRFPIPLGDLGQQWHVLKHLRSADLIYSPCQTQTQMLGYLRRAGMWRVPIVCLGHHPLDLGRLAAIRRPFLRANLLGTDACPGLSQLVVNETNRLTGRADSEVIPWGPQRDYYHPVEGPGEEIITAGRTGRDFVTFGLGATRAGVPARIICLASDVSPRFQEFGPNVQVDVQPADRPMGYKPLLKILSRARALAIPMADQPTAAGFTSLADALGLGRPVILTRNPGVDLDVEKLDIGRRVEPGDVAGWEVALRWFDTHPDESMAMGRRARALVDGGLNSEGFARQMAQIFDAVLKRNGRAVTKGAL